MAASDSPSVLTIGYGNRSPKDFFQLLSLYRIEHVVDVRSRPESKFNPEFGHESLANLAARHHLEYTFLGDLLGGIPAEGHRNEEGKVDYNSIRQTIEFRNGLRRVASLSAHTTIALLCAELRPEQCHRCKLVGAALAEHQINVNHIDERGLLISQSEAIFRINQGQRRLDMTDAHTTTSRNTHDY